MSGLSKIEWCDATWNPVRGCSRVSEGCRNCYAERLAARFGWPMPGASTYLPTGERDDDPARAAEMTEAGPRWTGRVALVPEALDWPLRRRKPIRIFVNSMSDLFHEALPSVHIAAVFGAMLLAQQHTFLILTKRPARARAWMEWIATDPVFMGDTREGAKRFNGGPAATCLALLSNQVTDKNWRGPLFTALLCSGVEPPVNAPLRKLWPLPNVWLGVSVEDQATADERMPILQETPAAHRFISAEPLLGPIDFDASGSRGAEDGDPCSFSALTGLDGVEPPIPGIDWVIAGGESGPGARPCEIQWIRSIVGQCRAASVPCFVKQVGSNAREWRFLGRDHLYDTGERRRRLKVRGKGGDPAEWTEDLRVRQVPA
jgi:protein gp37